MQKHTKVTSPDKARLKLEHPRRLDGQFWRKTIEQQRRSSLVTRILPDSSNVWSPRFRTFEDQVCYGAVLDHKLQSSA